MRKGGGGGGQEKEAMVLVKTGFHRLIYLSQKEERYFTVPRVSFMLRGTVVRARWKQTRTPMPCRPEAKRPITGKAAR